MEARKIEVTPEMLEKALRCCASDDPARRDFDDDDFCSQGERRDEEGKEPV